MTDKPKPRRMKANPDRPFFTPHNREHDQLDTCEGLGCLPVDAPEPRKVGETIQSCQKCGGLFAADGEMFAGTPCRCGTPTPPPAAAPEGTPVERHLGHSDIADYYIAKQAAPNTLTAALVGIIERLCAEWEDDLKALETVNDRCEEQRTRADTAEAKVCEICKPLHDFVQGCGRFDGTDAGLCVATTTVKYANEFKKERDQLKADLAAARGLEAKLREYYEAVQTHPVNYSAGNIDRVSKAIRAIREMDATKEQS